MREMSEGWKNNIVTSAYKEGDKQRWKIIEELSYLMHVVYYVIKF